MSTGSTPITWITHVRTRLALHQLRGGPGRPLLVLHGLAERAPVEVPAYAQTWAGPVLAIDLGGHGLSSRAPGGGYTAEIMMGDIDAVLAEIGPATIIGRGLGAYVALLIAGARPQLVVGAILCDGPGLAGGGPAPHSPTVVAPAPSALGVSAGGTAAVPDPWVPDPFVLAELSNDVRPGDYATTYVRQAMQFSGHDHPIAVTAVARPPWLEAVVNETGVVTETIDEALARYGALVG